MIIKSFVFLALIGLSIIEIGCSVIKGEQPFFKVKNAFYQSWMKNENEKGTSMYLELSNVKQGIVFDSIIFRGNMLPLISENENNITKLSAALIVGTPRISLEKKIVNKPDQLLYQYNGKRYYYPVNFHRKEMKYLK